MSYPFSIVLHNAIHEPMHPPYHADDPKVREAIDLLGRDPLVVDKVQHHDPSFGYNTTAGYIEEDSVQALEQLVSEKFGVGRNACHYWQEQDGGMHALAVAMYTDYKQASSRTAEFYSQWFTRAVQNGGSAEATCRKLLSPFLLQINAISPRHQRFLMATIPSFFDCSRITG